MARKSKEKPFDPSTLTLEERAKAYEDGAKFLRLLERESKKIEAEEAAKKSPRPPKK